MNKKLKYMPTAIFLCVVFVLTTLFVALPKSEFSSSEKRILEKFPETNLETITNGKFEKGFENYLADHFPFRNMWVGINTYYNYIIGNNGNKGVVNVRAWSTHTRAWRIGTLVSRSYITTFFCA